MVSILYIETLKMIVMKIMNLVRYIFSEIQILKTAVLHKNTITFKFNYYYINVDKL